MIKQKPPKPKKCEVLSCRTEFVPQRIGQKVCSVACSILDAQAKREKTERALAKQERIALKAAKEKLVTHGQWLGRLQRAVNRYARALDKFLPCISCGLHKKTYDAGHYRSVGSMSSLRFHLDNIHKQCVQCNQSKSGNAIEYRIRLVDKIGVERVEFLERHDHPPLKLTVPDIKEGITLFNRLAQDLETGKSSDYRQALFLHNTAPRKVA